MLRSWTSFKGLFHQVRTKREKRFVRRAVKSSPPSPGWLSPPHLLTHPLSRQSLCASALLDRKRGHDLSPPPVCSLSYLMCIISEEQHTGFDLFRLFVSDAEQTGQTRRCYGLYTAHALKRTQRHVKARLWSYRDADEDEPQRKSEEGGGRVHQMKRRV